jgi:cytochrome c oxidase cbb3-type subunit 3
MNNPLDTPPSSDEPLRPHIYDGTQEYDNRLPNWWLFTLFGTIIFSVLYWSFVHHWRVADEPGFAVEKSMKENTLAAAKNSGVLSDEQMWQMSHDPAVLAAGHATFDTTCASCHLTDLSGKIGPNLRDEIWLHGSMPHEIMTTITSGVPAKGMPTWGPVLGRTKISEVAAYILSYHAPSAAPAATPDATEKAQKTTASALEAEAAVQGVTPAEPGGKMQMPPPKPSEQSPIVPAK